MHHPKVHGQQAVSKSHCTTDRQSSSPAATKVSPQSTAVNLRDSRTKAQKDSEHFQNLRQYKSISTRGQETHSAKGQTINILGFVRCTVSWL